MNTNTIHDTPGGSDLMSFLRLRKYIGVLGFTLPFQIIAAVGLLSSISYSYYTGFHDLFVANLCVIGLFLFCDKGYDQRDTWANRIAGVCAILVALNPCNSNALVLWVIPQYLIHYAAASVLFLTLGFISCFLFTMSSGAMTAMKHVRNAVYIGCGIMIFASVFVIIIFSMFKIHIFIPESTCLLPFGFAWAVKGETILTDGEVLI